MFLDSQAMSVPKTLLLTPTPPGQGSVGEHFLRRLVQCFPHESIVCYAPWSISYAVPVFSEELDWLPLQSRKLPTEHYVSKSRKPWLDAWASYINRPKHWAALTDHINEAVEFGSKHNVKIVLAVMASPSTIKMARRVAEQLNAELVPLIWDPIQTTMEHLGFDIFSQRNVLRELDQILSSVKRCGVASESMSTEMRLKYGLDCSVMIRPVELDLLREQGTSGNNDYEFVIVFSGSGYAKAEIKSLVNTLSYLDWQIGGRQIVLKLLGNYIELPVSIPGKRAKLEFLGYRPLSETIEIVSQAHVAYLPYWFDPKFRISVQNCFPDKMGTYITAGAPVLFHGPADSTPARFLERYPVGISCHSLQTEEIAQSLKQLLPENLESETTALARKQAVKEELHPEKFLQRIAHLLRANNSDMVKYWDSN